MIHFIHCTRCLTHCINNYIIHYFFIYILYSQAAEKALKACLISKDIQAVNIKSHDLCDLASAIKDDYLVKLASNLQIIIGFVGQLRYPDYLPYPKIPHDMYSEEQARRAAKLTRTLLCSIVETYISEGEELGAGDNRDVGVRQDQCCGPTELETHNPLEEEDRFSDS